jgi:hypothetical protein
LLNTRNNKLIEKYRDEQQRQIHLATKQALQNYEDSMMNYCNMNITPTTDELSNKHLEVKSNCLAEFNLEIKSCDHDKVAAALCKLEQVSIIGIILLLISQIKYFQPK